MVFILNTGTMPRDFRIQVFYIDLFPPDYTIRAVLLFSNICGDICSSFTGVVETGGKWKISSIRNVPPVSITLVELVAKFATGVIETSGAP